MTEVELGPYRLGIANDFGPRIVSLSREGGPELLAQLEPGKVIEFPGGVYRFHGGHRLWASPEIPEVTYANDDHACRVRQEADAVTVVAPPDSAGLAKTIAISRRDSDLLVAHSISGRSPRQLAAWAITQFPLGGTAILSMAGEDTGPRPNRNMVFWPYTELNDPRFRLRKHAAIIEAGQGPPLKIGAGPAPQGLGYLREGWLFFKKAHERPGGDTPDFGAVSQVYVGQGFCELENVGGRVDVSTEAASIAERWRVVPCDDVNEALDLILGGDEA